MNFNLLLKHTKFISYCYVLLALCSGCSSPKLGEDNLEDIVAALSTEQKVNLVLGTGSSLSNNDGPAVGITYKNRVPGAAGTTYKIAEMNIPSMVFADGPAGVRIFPTRENSTDTYYGTAFPIASLLASSWDIPLIESVGKAMGEEAKEYGVDVVLAPALNIHRYPLGGRNFEYFSEDPLISGLMSAALVSGIQSEGVGTSLKHYVANNHEWNRGNINVKVSERALREIYLRGFEIAIQKSQPWTVMSSYNKVNGEYTSESTSLLTDILRDELNFNGLVMTDWFGGIDAVKQMKAGNDLLMPGTEQQRSDLLAALNSGELEESTLDRNVKNVLRLAQKSLIFSKYAYSEKPDLKGNAQIARQAAAEGMVLLENRNNVLPIKPGTAIAVFGNYSYDMITGGTGSGDVNEAYVITLEDGLKNVSIDIDLSLPKDYKTHIHSEKAKIPEPKTPLEAFFPKPPLPELHIPYSRAEKLANDNELALITLGRTSGEFEDRKKEDFYLTEKEIELIDTVTQAFHKKNKPVVVILNIGGVMEMASWKDKVDAIVLAYQPGQEAGNAVADVLVGNINPSGKLIDTFSYNLTDYPAHKGFPGIVLDESESAKLYLKGSPSEVNYDKGIWLGYRYFNTFKKNVLYPFGYGKSYTSFKYSELELSEETFQNSIKASVTIENSGEVAGKEVVQLYLSAPKTKLDKPSEELRAFAKTKLLAPGESQTLEFELNPRDLTSFDESTGYWHADSGEYLVHIAASSRDFRLTKRFTLNEDLAISP